MGRFNPDLAKQILQIIDARSKPGRLCGGYIPDIFPTVDESSEIILECLKHCNNRHYLDDYHEYQHFSFGVRGVTDEGYAFLDGADSAGLASTPTVNIGSIGYLSGNFSVGNNLHQNAAQYGDNAHIDQSVTTNIGSSLAEIKELISAKPAADQEQLQEILRLLTEISQNDEPVKKGLLAKFSDGLKKHSDILTAIGNWAVQIMMVSGQ